LGGLCRYSQAYEQAGSAQRVSAELGVLANTRDRSHRQLPEANPAMLFRNGATERYMACKKSNDAHDGQEGREIGRVTIDEDNHLTHLLHYLDFG
jgi:hypothetical protein